MTCRDFGKIFTVEIVEIKVEINKTYSMLTVKVGSNGLKLHY